MKNQFDLNSNILSGAELRVLLNSDHISYGEVQTTLKEKGVFVGSIDKSVTVPLLSAMLLTPDNFSRLIEASVVRESKLKTKISTLQLINKDVDWRTPLRGDIFDDDVILIEESENLNFVESPDVVIEGKSVVKIQYVVVKKDYSKDWLEREIKFCGDVCVRQVGDSLALEFLSHHTAKETESINRKIISLVSKILNTSGATSSVTPQGINFDSFDNIERIRFFKRLTSGMPPRLKVGNVDNMDIVLDEAAPELPSDPQIAWMKNAVKGLKIDGERLNNIFLIADEMYYQYYHVRKIDVEFDFSLGANSGSCGVCFSFSAPARTEGAYKKGELAYSFVKIVYDNAVNTESKKNINSDLEIIIKELINKHYKSMIDERGVPAE
ncbi:hypothetical protein [Nitratidesulfovibrio sp. SRB-5]|uniref:GapS4b family protein n=1 Tax=Nitratidesulfovibrio sp. SRB-5 TaxID=2872636 RepID=UPI0010269C8A|nr:hypothetical protein [Nitratidesulfovibrio sp. SRB-5]MBZ2172063.1 hypothetical protein [Nitratidesulfovibrio sp. SRB-5]RXF77570.1 hypothetical protein EKK70_06205 [Desulfovibrio sp. DS-1]